MKITNTCAYAITAMTLIASQSAGLIVLNSSICEAANLPAGYVSQVLRKLVNEHLLVSVRGVGSGYKLERQASTITLLEIVEANDGPIVAVAPFALEGMTPESASTVGKALTSIAGDTRERLASITLADLRVAKTA